MRLGSKTALVTGAARGIGLAIAQTFAREGARVVMADIDGAAARQAADELARSGAEALGQATDVTDPASVAAGIAAARDRFGRLDILVNNAGIGGKTPFLETTLEEWERILRVNLTGAFLTAQAAARAMVDGGSGGAIINIVSISGQRGGDGRAAYGSAKAGLELLTRVMAVELAPHAIRVNAIAPGPIETVMARDAHDPASRAAYGYLVPMRRYGRVEDVADAALFLASDESRYVQGHTLNVDGGFAAAGLMFRAGSPPGPSDLTG